MTTHRVHISVFPLGSNEPARVLAAVREAWVPPSFISRRFHDGAWLVTVEMEAALPDGDDEAAFVERLSVAIWRRVGRFVKVVVETAHDEAADALRRELGRVDYLKLMRAV